MTVVLDPDWDDTDQVRISDGDDFEFLDGPWEPDDWELEYETDGQHKVSNLNQRANDPSGRIHRDRYGL